jgi:lysophospholipase L1-like esterase
MPRISAIAFSLLGFVSPACAQERTDLIRVACIGDSITYGAGVEDREKNCYPTVLQSLLGDKYEVRNYGVSGATLMKKGDRPYIKEAAYQKALAFKPNIVIIMLGTNDTKPKNWSHADDFTADYKSLIASFQKLDSKPRVILCTPVPAYPENFGISDERIRTGVRPKVEQLGKELKLPVIDLYAALSDKKELFPDKVHPNAEGAKLMAETVAAALGVK